MITALGVSLNRTHFSRYEPARAAVEAKITVTPVTGNPGTDQVRVTLRRRAGEGERTLTERILTVPADASGGIKASFDLRAVLDAEGFNAARRSKAPGDYRVVAEVVGAAPAVEGSASLTVVLLTVEEMRSRWLLGLPLLTMERLEPRLQPQAVTGVKVVDVSQDTPIGARTLAYVKGPPATLAWAGGTPVQIEAGATRQYVLPASGAGFVVVEADAVALPASAASETLSIQHGRMSDEAIWKDVMDLTDDIETAIQVFLEPTKVVTSHLLDPKVPNTKRPTEWDEVGDGVAWYKPSDGMRWITIKLPYHSLIHIKELTGFFNLQRTVEINREWLTWTEKTGVVELVPSNLAVINWIFFGIGFYTFFSTYGEVPQFWQFQITCGFREVPDAILNFIARRAAIAVLNKAGLARYPAGVTGYSIGRDGVSESRSLTPGVYEAAIKRYERETEILPDGRDMGLIKLRDKYRGLAFVTL